MPTFHSHMRYPAMEAPLALLPSLPLTSRHHQRPSWGPLWAQLLFCTSDPFLVLKSRALAPAPVPYPEGPRAIFLSLGETLCPPENHWITWALFSSKGRNLPPMDFSSCSVLWLLTMSSANFFSSYTVFFNFLFLCSLVCEQALHFSFHASLVLAFLVVFFFFLF